MRTVHDIVQAMTIKYRNATPQYVTKQIMDTLESEGIVSLTKDYFESIINDKKETSDKYDDMCQEFAHAKYQLKITTHSRDEEYSRANKNHEKAVRAMALLETFQASYLNQRLA